MPRSLCEGLLLLVWQLPLPLLFGDFNRRHPVWDNKGTSPNAHFLTSLLPLFSPFFFPPPPRDHHTSCNERRDSRRKANLQKMRKTFHLLRASYTCDISSKSGVHLPGYASNIPSHKSLQFSPTMHYSLYINPPLPWRTY